MTKFSMLLATALVSASPAYAATTLTFEGQGNTIYAAPITRSGFLLGNPTGQEQHFHEIDSANASFGLTSNGTGVLLNDRDTQLFLQQVGGGAFALTSFDIATSGALNSGGLTYTVTGFLGGAQVGQRTGSLGAFTTVAGFGNVDYVVFDGAGGSGGGFELDNVVLNAGGAVPEPATWAMMIGGFGLVGASMRRRKVSVSFA